MISSHFTDEETDVKQLSNFVQLVGKPALKSKAQVPLFRLVKLRFWESSCVVCGAAWAGTKIWAPQGLMRKGGGSRRLWLSQT